MTGVTAGTVVVLVIGVVLGLAGAVCWDRVRRGDAERWYRLGAQVRAISARLRECADLQALLDEAADALGGAIDVDQLLVQLVQGDRVMAPSAAFRRAHPPADATAPSLWGSEALDDPVTLRAGHAVTVDLRRAAAPTAHLRSVAEATGAQVVAVVPVVAAGDLLAVLVATGSGRRRFTPQETALMEAVAWSVSRALQSQRLGEQKAALQDGRRQLDRSKSDFVASVSHELRTPLTSIAGYAEMLLDGDGGPVSEGQREMLDIIGRNTGRLQTLIEDLLTIGKIESAAPRVEPGDVPVALLLRAAEAVMAPAVSAADLRLEVASGGDLVIEGDRDQLEQVLLNLVGNAVKFTPAGGRVTLGAADLGHGRVELTVTDTGIGVPEQEQGHLFTRFFRASNATERATPGAGLGLSIVESIVAAHGGEVTLASTEGVGTLVTVRLPGHARVPAPS